MNFTGVVIDSAVMAIFTCKIGLSDGTIVEKEYESADEGALKQTLQEQGFFVFTVSRKTLQVFSKKGSSRRKIDNKELIAFNQELLVLIKSGLPIIQSLDTILERVEKGHFSTVLKAIREDIKGGTSLSEAFERHQGTFSHLYVASLKAGERTGDLPQTIRRYIAFLKKTEGFKKKIIAAMIYPAILVVAAFLAVSMLLVYVVPTFSQVYADSGAQLPVPTQMLIGFTTVLKKFFPLMVGAVMVGTYLFKRWVRTSSGRYRVDAIQLRMPYIGDLIIKYSVVSFTRTLATVIESGIPIVESLKMSVGTLNNMILERKLLAAVKNVEEGMSLSIAIEKAKIMPPLALRMLSVGEGSGALGEMLEEISNYFEEVIDERLHILSTAIEPAIMIIMGVVIGTIIVTMYLPVFKIAGTVG